jgi:hypothetical protein
MERTPVTIKLDTFIRKPFEVEAVQITEANIHEVAKWCKGVVRTSTTNGVNKNYIKANFHHPMAKYKPLAFVGDWVSFANNGYKIYTNNAFDTNFEPISSDSLK